MVENAGRWTRPSGRFAFTNSFLARLTTAAFKETLSTNCRKALFVGLEAKTLDWPPQFGRTIQAMDLRHGGIDEYTVDVQLLQLTARPSTSFSNFLFLAAPARLSGALGHGSVGFELSQRPAMAASTVAAACPAHGVKLRTTRHRPSSSSSMWRASRTPAQDAEPPAPPYRGSTSKENSGAPRTS